MQSAGVNEHVDSGFCEDLSNGLREDLASCKKTLCLCAMCCAHKPEDSDEEDDSAVVSVFGVQVSNPWETGQLPEIELPANEFSCLPEACLPQQETPGSMA